ncbi:hypothetical protein [Corynebacterium sp. HMSC077B05]|uniref:hypothetical protein n=1 Tax=Corynebacterium sp. HMSC077B05 TaxID=1739252 RepID=UPI0008A5C58D|nr:hypothetical protein [Corynebacterium sp. HMSC077B05]OFL77030.1 hypothetical protein HMPREF2748_05620 [Corynebacterium sp. HMSC077B05]
MTIIKPHALALAADELVKRINEVIIWHMSNPNLSVKGRNEGIQSAVKRLHYAEAAESLQTAAEAVRAAVTLDYDDIRATSFPTPKGTQETIAAELAAARYLVTDKTPESVMHRLQTLDPTPARTIHAEESVKRGIILATEMDQLVVKEYPSYDNRSKAENNAEMFLNGMRQLAALIVPIRDNGAVLPIDADMQLRYIHVAIESELMLDQYSVKGKVPVPSVQRDRVFSTVPAASA